MLMEGSRTHLSNPVVNLYTQFADSTKALVGTGLRERWSKKIMSFPLWPNSDDTQIRVGGTLSRR